MSLAQEFANRWRLNEESQQRLYALQPARIQRVVEQFQPAPGTTDVNAKFLRFLQGAEGSVHDVTNVPPESGPNGPTESEVRHFGARHGVDERALQMVLNMPAQVQANILSGFNPPPGTTNASGRLMNFAKNALQNFKSKVEISQTGSYGGSMGSDGGGDDIKMYVRRMGLDAGCEKALRNAPPAVAQQIMQAFSPPTETMNVSSLFIKFCKKTPGIDGGTDAPAPPFQKGNQGKGKGGGKGGGNQWGGSQGGAQYPSYYQSPQAGGPQQGGNQYLGQQRQSKWDIGPGGGQMGEKGGNQWGGSPGSGKGFSPYE